MNPALSHPAPEALELYVIGAHDQAPARMIEAHLRQCEDCTAEVRRQAQVDLALGEVAADAVFCPGCGAVLVTSVCQHCGAVAEAGGFVVERVIVQNAHGRMYLARDPQGAPVALKELAFVQPPHPETLEAFEREGRLLRQLSHPRIPRFLASFSVGQGVNMRLYLAQEYVEGESLLARLRTHQFTEEEAREIARQVLSIIEHLQSLAPMVFHRDVKPANLIRRPDGQIALVDFGAARDLGSTVGATLVGTFGYMPVEQMGGIVDATTDLYALGATLCHLLSRREPWSLLEDPAALGRLNVTSGFRDFLARLTARRPGDRHPSAAVAASALRAPAPRRRRLAWPRLRLGAAAVLLSGLAITVGGAVAFVATNVRPQPIKALRGATGTVSEPRVHREIIGETFIGVTDGAGKTTVSPTRTISLRHERGQLAIDPSDPAFALPVPGKGSPDRNLWIEIRLCVAAEGNVTTARVVDSTHPELNTEIEQRVKTWTYRPELVDGRVVSFCTDATYQIAPDFPRKAVKQPRQH